MQTTYLGAPVYEGQRQGGGEPLGSRGRRHGAYRLRPRRDRAQDQPPDRPRMGGVAEDQDQPPRRARLCQLLGRGAGRAAGGGRRSGGGGFGGGGGGSNGEGLGLRGGVRDPPPDRDRKSTRLNSSHQIISYAVFCLKKKKKIYNRQKVSKLGLKRVSSRLV